MRLWIYAERNLSVQLSALQMNIKQTFYIWFQHSYRCGSIRRWFWFRKYRWNGSPSACEKLSFEHFVIHRSDAIELIYSGLCLVGKEKRKAEQIDVWPHVNWIIIRTRENAFDTWPDLGGTNEWRAWREYWFGWYIIYIDCQWCQFRLVDRWRCFE